MRLVLARCFIFFALTLMTVGDITDYDDTELGAESTMRDPGNLYTSNEALLDVIPIDLKPRTTTIDQALAA